MEHKEIMLSELLHMTTLDGKCNNIREREIVVTKLVLHM